MKIVVTTKKPVISPDGRRLARDIPIDVAELYGRFLIAEGLALPLEVKEAQDRPTGALARVHNRLCRQWPKS